MKKIDPIKKAKILELKGYIRKAGLVWREDSEFLAEYVKTKGDEYEDQSLEDIEVAIECFRNLISQKL